MRRNIGIFALCLTPAVARPQSDTLVQQRDLALTLLEFAWQPTGRPVALYVGAPGGGFPVNILPPGARLLGGANAYTVFAVPGTQDSAGARFRAHLESVGWRVPTELRELTGFANSPPPTGLPRAFCNDVGVVFIATRPRFSMNETLIQVQYSRPYRGSPCEANTFGATSLDDFEMPTLVPPTGARTQGAGMRGGASSNGGAHRVAYAQLQSTMPALDVVAHYADQLRQLGWTVSPPHADADVGSVTLRKRDAKGRAMIGILTDARSDLDRHFLSMRVDLLKTDP